MMTIDERKMAIAYGDLLNIQELVQHIIRMKSYVLFGEDAKMAFAEIQEDVDRVLADAGRYMSEHTDFNAEGKHDD